MTDPGESETVEVVLRRKGILRHLRESPAHKRDLVEMTDHSRSTIDRAVRELTELDLVERSEGGVSVTTAGRLALDHLSSFQAGFDDIVSAEAVVDPLPPDSPLSTAIVAGSEAMLATEPVPYRPLERVHDALADADSYRALLPSLDDPRQVRLLYEHVVTDGSPAEIVVTPDLFRTLREEFPRRITAMAESDAFTVLVADDLPPFALSLATGESSNGPETDAFVAVFTENGAVHGVLANDSAGAVRWADGRYERARERATEQTESLFANTDGGTLGVDPGDGLTALGESLSVSLEREGFVRPDVSYFRDEPIAKPTTAWRAGLSLAEVHTGYAVERTQSPGDRGSSAPTAASGNDAPETQTARAETEPEQRPLTDAVFADLAAGTDCILVGPPGSGKSTLCKRVACRWYERDCGPVLYREQGRGRPFESVGDVEATADAADGHALVVLEDAVRPEASAIFAAIERLDERDDVSFLLDARENEWVDPPEPIEHDPDLAVRTMPPLSRADCERLVAHFEQTVGESVDVPAARLWEEVSAEATDGEAAPSELLLLLHRLATYADPLADGQTSLEEAVATVYSDLQDDDLATDICLLVNALNAAGLDFDPVTLYAVADSESLAAVEEALDRLEGRVLFPTPDGGYRTVHESWSVAFLTEILETAGRPAAAERFGDAVSALLALADNPDQCERITAHLAGQWHLGGVTDDPTEWAAETIESIYALGRERPKLAPLFGDGAADTIRLPAARPDEVADSRPVWLGRMFLAGGYYDAAERAFERLPESDSDRAVERLLGLSQVALERGRYGDVIEMAEECLALLEGADRPLETARATFEYGRALEGRGDLEAARERYAAALDTFEGTEDRRRTARVLGALGGVARQQGAHEAAERFHRRSRSVTQDLGDRRGGADALHQLGTLAWSEGEYEQAREYMQRSLDIRRELGDRRGESESFNMLGIIAKHLGESEQARKYMQRSLDIAQDLGMRGMEASVLGNLGLIAERRGEFDRAREAIKRSLEIGRDLGKERLEAVRLNNLGLVAVQQGDHDVAREAFESGREIAAQKDIPRQEANSNNGIGHVARLRGEYDRAREHHERALAITRETGVRRRVADSLNKLGLVAMRRDDSEEAADYFQRSLAVARDIDHPHEEVIALLGLGNVARKRGNYDRAGEHLDVALQQGELTGDRMLQEQVRLLDAHLALDLGESDRARDLAQQVLDAFTEMGARQWAARSRGLLGEIAAETDSPEAARERWEAALATLESVDAPEDALATLQRLVDYCGGQTEAWRSRARDIASTAPSEVAARYREWLDEESVGSGH